MLVMQILLRKRPSLSHVSSALSLNDVLTSNEINHLLAVFEHRYSPWLSMSLGFLSPHPFLVMVQCAVAARYLDPIRRSSVLPEIYGLVDSYVARLTFSSVQSLETVAAFLILSLWPSGAGTPDGSLQDSRMIASSAVSAAMQLSLDRSVTSAIQLHSSHVSNDGQLEIALNRVRLWLSLVSAEWMLCLGTGRTPTSRHADQDYEVLRRISPSTLHCGSRDLRLDFLTRIQSIAEKAIHMGTHEDDSEGVHRFRDEAGSILTQLDSVYSSIQPLASISDYETYHFQMLILQYHTYRLLALCRFLEELRSHAVHNGLGAFQSKGWVAALEPLQRRLTAQWGMAAIIAAQSVLITFLAAPVSDEDLLSTPDNVLAMISLSGAVVILTKTSLMRDYGNGDGLLLHSSDALVPRVVARLHRIADASMCAARCAEVLEIVHGTWKTEHDVYLRTTQQQTRGEKRRRESTPGPPHSTGECLTAEQQEGQAMFSGIPYEGFAFDSIFAQNMYAGPGQDILLDMNFWGAFTQNLQGT
ncbi:hypothetical protein GLOTRDRAFT_138027 [Gloeophyllum trabeum ATCC 11539]|uniref:Transcription factor domain-containing protein n=1 Tax=Gloeophyllum trabeum (strain ATCC 11539 / FP-39264 / Madison 617) TaxID=670483 RepID=S7Q8C5_GLOTA|nr:uncharacterized protein GLOTRDRAFT_138027 [Gloeophyllum trabeum ATCC 11539]EPQ56236.1 hypothetical protein GLOTRDRAFT_138027 [Gloeophyllum trabeum ATCC 11539]